MPDNVQVFVVVERVLFSSGSASTTVKVGKSRRASATIINNTVFNKMEKE